MEIYLRAEIPSREQFWSLFATTGWNDQYQLQPDELIAALQASWYVLSAYDGDHLVGFGRVVSDGIVHAMIYDLIVAPEYQGRGIGASLLERLVSRCQASRIRDIQLFCARGKRAFYEKRGFQARSLDAPGMQYAHPA